MVSVVNCYAISGIDVIPVFVETDVSNGLPSFDMVGLLSSEVKESRERVRTAIKNSGFMIPAKKITINLAPANIRKAGTYFDLPIAVSILASLGIIDTPQIESMAFAGELSLNGDIVPVNGVLSIVLMAVSDKKKICIIPKENYGECSTISYIEVIGVKSLNDTIRVLKMSEEELHNEAGRQRAEYEIESLENEEMQNYDFEDVFGQKQAVEGAKIAAAGMHNMLMIGPPGAGKTLIAKTMVSILPEMSLQERIEISRIQSIAGNLNGQLIEKRPFRSPHHTATVTSITGGGLNPKPGEVTLAHGGVLYMDEFPEFPRAVLETLRQPLEERKIVISRIGGKYVFPAGFMLLASMNPCRCGYYPDRNKCSCTEYDVRKYREKVSGPLLDRIDICVNMQPIDYKKIGNCKGQKSSSEIREQVNCAVEIQRERYKDIDTKYNSMLEGKMIEEFCHLNKDENNLMEQIYYKFELSMRAYGKVIKTARTIADLNGHKDITKSDIAEAVTFRPPVWH